MHILVVHSAGELEARQQEGGGQQVNEKNDTKTGVPHETVVCVETNVV